MTSNRFFGDASPGPDGAGVLRFVGNCTTAVSVEDIDAARIRLRLRLSPRRPPREGSMTVNCVWQRRGVELNDGGCVDLTRSSAPPPARPGALVLALLHALGRGDTDIDEDAPLRSALHGAVVTSRVRLFDGLAVVLDADGTGKLRSLSLRNQHPLIVRFLPVLQ